MLQKGKYVAWCDFLIVPTLFYWCIRWLQESRSHTTNRVANKYAVAELNKRIDIGL